MIPIKKILMVGVLTTLTACNTEGTNDGQDINTLSTISHNRSECPFFNGRFYSEDRTSYVTLSTKQVEDGVEFNQSGDITWDVDGQTHIVEAPEGFFSYLGGCAKGVIQIDLEMEGKKVARLQAFYDGDNYRSVVKSFDNRIESSDNVWIK